MRTSSSSRPSSQLASDRTSPKRRGCRGSRASAAGRAGATGGIPTWRRAGERRPPSGARSAGTPHCPRATRRARASRSRRARAPRRASRGARPRPPEISCARPATVPRSMSAAMPSLAAGPPGPERLEPLRRGSASPPPRRRNRILVLPGGFGEGYQRRALPSGVGASMSMGRLGSGFIAGVGSVQVVRSRTVSGAKDGHRTAATPTRRPPNAVCRVTSGRQAVSGITPAAGEP